MPNIPNPAAVPGIMPSEIAGARDDLPLAADPHFGTDDEGDAKESASDGEEISPVEPEDR
jgi:hypothetical protein